MVALVYIINRKDIMRSIDIITTTTIIITTKTYFAVKSLVLMTLSIAFF
jgi:hypothetical protein